MVEAGIQCQISGLKPTCLHSFFGKKLVVVAGMKVYTPNSAVCAGSRSIQKCNAGHSGLLSVQISDIKHSGSPKTLCFLEPWFFAHRTREIPEFHDSALGSSQQLQALALVSF